jgi:type I restriction enzyme R subunit/putative DNA methylase
LPLNAKRRDPEPVVGPTWLADTRIASMVAEYLRYGATQRKLYELYGWIIMPNHVHAVFEPKVPLPRIMQWIKGRTARVANRILNRTNEPFWQDESYDHWIRSSKELSQCIEYVENNPVTAGLSESPNQWPWSSARD